MNAIMNKIPIENVIELIKTNTASLFLAVFSTVNEIIHSTSFEKYTDGRKAESKRSENLS